MDLKWPTHEEFEAGSLETRALSDARGPEVVEDDAWQTNVMVRVANDERFDLEPMPLEVDLEYSRPGPGANVTWGISKRS